MIVSRSQWLLLCWFPLIYSFRRSPQRTLQIYWRNTLKPLPSLTYRTEKLQGEHIHCSHISHLFSGVTCCTVCQMLQVTLHQEKKFHSLCLVHWRIKNIARYFITFLILILIKIKQLQTCIKLSSNVLYCTHVLHFNPGRLCEEYTTNLHKYVPFLYYWKWNFNSSKEMSNRNKIFPYNASGQKRSCENIISLMEIKPNLT